MEMTTLAKDSSGFKNLKGLFEEIIVGVVDFMDSH